MSMSNHILFVLINMPLVINIVISALNIKRSFLLLSKNSKLLIPMYIPDIIVEIDSEHIIIIRNVFPRFPK